MWKKNDEETYTPPSGPTTPPAARAGEPRRSTAPAVIGESIRVEGEIRGAGDLVIEGEVEGRVHLSKHSVTVGRSGRVKADVHGGVLVVEGRVQGNLFADEQAVVKASGEVRGNITSPRVSLEDGAKFKGSIDMEPRADGRSGGSGPAGGDDPASSKAAGGGAGGGPGGEAGGGAGGGPGRDQDQGKGKGPDGGDGPEGKGGGRNGGQGGKSGGGSGGA